MAEKPEEMAAVVTGHSRGIGAGIAEHLLRRGISVLGVSRGSNPDLAGRFATKLQEVQLDLGDSDGLVAWLASDALQRFLGPRSRPMLVNNAGVLQPIGPLDVQRAADVIRAVAVNVGAVLALSAAFVVATSKADERRILHISSGAARKAYAGWSVYCATKAALDHHARAVVQDRTPALRICSLAPGVIDTEMQAEIRGTTTERFPQRERFVALKREGELHDPRKRGGQIVEFLLSDSFGRETVTELDG